ncbi:uncharacterized protein LOC127091209 [Lathyrus oleraceus]|uniref:Transmembrane protein n=1 Tax=Pisum sativum TaxID=3888 RepID=A0A9D4WBP6_PEA|nr:uncharacterized protein LOC127091209 [Pisum sativum]KAI5399116.1 hypothetical protein KIW84_064479 [Pisum sativum]
MNQGTNWYRHMGDGKIRMGNNHKKKKENITSFNGGGASGGNGGGNDIAGLILAAVGFIAVVTFSITKHRTKPKPKPQNSLDQKFNKSIEDHEIETNQGFHALLQPSTATTKDQDVALCEAITDAKSINHTFIEEDKIESVYETKTISEVVSETSFHHDEIVLSDDFNSESAVSEAEKMDDDDDEAASEIVTEKNCSWNTILNTAEKQDLSSKDEGEKIDMQNEEHGGEKTDTEVAAAADVIVEAETEITSEEKEGNLAMEVNDQDHESILVSNSNQFSSLLLLLPGLLLLLVLLLLMHFTKNIFSAIGL